MNPHARPALLVPLLASALAVPPVAAAQAAPVERAPAAPAAPAAAVCKLVVAPGTNPVEFDLTLAGFPSGKRVKVRGAENFERTVDAQGAFTEQDVKKGTYTVYFGGGRHQGQQQVSCEKPARVAPVNVRISEVQITKVSTATPDVDCKASQPVTFEGKLIGTGTGTVEYVWSGEGRQTSPDVKFTAPETPTVNFVVKSPTRNAPTDPAPRVSAVLRAGNASDPQAFTLTCKPGT
ncbi:hypothetical protein ABZ924_17210 [Streptomyces sp. NPDC046876]|uniref:hypothetical protein n=1 Tax=Streptomyces sp. NPDC046876 TaxID=3155616 RepID=UPI0033C3725A